MIRWQKKLLEPSQSYAWTLGNLSALQISSVLMVQAHRPGLGGSSRSGVSLKPQEFHRGLSQRCPQLPWLPCRRNRTWKVPTAIVKRTSPGSTAYFLSWRSPGPGGTAWRAKKGPRQIRRDQGPGPTLSDKISGWLMIDGLWWVTYFFRLAMVTQQLALFPPTWSY